MARVLPEKLAAEHRKTVLSVKILIDHTDDYVLIDWFGVDRMVAAGDHTEWEAALQKIHGQER